MSVAGGSTANLTSKFSRKSLKNATGHASVAKVHSREEELARATNKRFNSESWRNVSRNYRAFPSTSASARSGVSNSNSFSHPNTQIICALSSLTEDQAFQTGSSSIPILSRSAAYVGSNFGTVRGFPTRRGMNGHPSHSSYKQENQVKIVKAATSSTASSSGAEEEDFHECISGQPNIHVSSTQPSSSVSLRSAAGRVPRLTTRRFGQAQTLRPEQKKAVASSYTKANPGGVFGSIRSVVSVFSKFFKLVQYLLMLPESIRQYFNKPRWSANGKSILITGASSGIGAELARQYAAQGAKVALVARTSADLDRVAEECRELGSGQALYYAADLSNPVSTKLAMAQAVKDFGNLDVVILNAGRGQGCYFEEIKDASQIESMIKLNVNGAITCLHYVLPQIPKTKDSRIVFMSNTAGIVAAPYQSVYSATKHALSGFANALRIELKTTYGHESPKICLVSLPEVSGTKCNSSRMDMGAKLPPAKWYSWAGLPLPHSVHKLTQAVAAGKREFGPSSKFNLWRSLYAICPDWVDLWMMQYIQKTHYRPLEEKTKHGSSYSRKMATPTPPTNKSWAC